MKLSEYTADEIVSQEPAIISELLDKWSHIKKTGEALENAAKVLLENGAEIPNWGLKQGSKTKKITNVRMAVELLLGDPSLDLKPSDLLDICSLPHGKIAEKIASNTGMSKKEAQGDMSELLGDLLTESQNRPSLKREKEE